MLPSQRDTTDTNDVTYEISELHESRNGLTIEVKGKPKELASTAPIFYDSSNDENLFFTLPDLNFDSNSEEDRKSGQINEQTDGNQRQCESPVKSFVERKGTSDIEDDSSDIKNFSVMRYLKKEKKNNIIIELNEVDEKGVVVKTEIVQANEFSVTSNSDNCQG